MRRSLLLAALGATTLLVAPAFAQNTATPGHQATGASSDASRSSDAGLGNAPSGDAGPGRGGTAGTMSGTAGMAGTGAGPTGTLVGGMGGSSSVLTSDHHMRVSKIVGSSVYDEQNNSIGSVDDILLSRDNTPAAAVISVGGFLGIGSKLVQVPYDKLKIGDDGKITMPGASKDALNGMPDYRYQG